MRTKGGPSLTDGWQVQGVSSPDCSKTKDSKVDVLEKKKKLIDNVVYLDIQRGDFTVLSEDLGFVQLWEHGKLTNEKSNY